jgi:rubredoxin
MGYGCSRCGFEFTDNMGGTPVEAVPAWRAWANPPPELRKEIAI